MMKRTCPKCGSDNLNTRFIEGESYLRTSYDREENEFVRSTKYDTDYKIISIKDHLKRQCKNCQYRWRENTLDSEESK